MAFPPTCIHLSCNQLQLESNSVDLCTRAECHLPVGTETCFPIKTKPVIWPQASVGVQEPSVTVPFPPLFPVFEIIALHLIQRVLIISEKEIRKEVDFSGMQARIWLSLKFGQSRTGDLLGQSFCNNKVNASNFSPKTDAEYNREERSLLRRIPHPVSQSPAVVYQNCRQEIPKHRIQKGPSPGVLSPSLTIHTAPMEAQHPHTEPT